MVLIFYMRGKIVVGDVVVVVAIEECSDKKTKNRDNPGRDNTKSQKEYHDYIGERVKQGLDVRCVAEECFLDNDGQMNKSHKKAKI
jgi:hypothetical protein